MIKKMSLFNIISIILLLYFIATLTVNNYNDIEVGSLFYITSNQPDKNINGYYYIEYIDTLTNTITYNTKLKLDTNIGNSIFTN